MRTAVSRFRTDSSVVCSRCSATLEQSVDVCEDHENTDTLDRAIQAVANYDEEVASTDPFEARFTVTVDGDAITLTIDTDLSVVDVTTHDRSVETRPSG